VVGSEQTRQLRICRAAPVEVGAHREEHERAPARVARARDQRVGERRALVLVAAGREELLELVDRHDQPPPGRGFADRLLERPPRPLAGPQERDRPVLAARQHARSERREQPRLQRRRLAAARRPDDPGQRRAGQPRDELADEPLAAEEELGVLDVERGQALEGADHHRLAAGPAEHRTLPAGRQLDDAARQVVLGRAQQRALGRNAARGVAQAADGRRARMLVRGGHRRSRDIAARVIEGCVLAQDRLVEPAQLGAGLDADLLDQRGPGRAVGLERVGLAAAAVQREHPLRVQPLAQRLCEHQRLELADHVAVASRLEVALDRELGGAQPQLFQPADLGGGERLAGDVVERGPAPQRQRLARPPGGDEPLEARHVELVGCEPQLVTVATRDDVHAVAGRGERLAQLRHVELHELRGGGRRRVAPEAVDQPVRRHRRAGVEREHRQQRARLARADGDGTPVDAGLYGP
jgi:hypothetical protein